MNHPIAIGMNARLFPNNWRPVRDEIAFAAQQGFAYIQLPGPEHGLDAERLGDVLAAVAEQLKMAGISAVMELLMQVDAAGHTANGLAPLDVLRANLPAIRVLGCNPVHWHLVPSAPLAAAQQRALEERLVAQFTAALELATAQGFRFGFEHNERAVGLFDTPTACAMLLDTEPKLGFVWDINHTHPNDLDSYLALAPRMTMLHISDTPLPETNYHLPLGQGSIDLTAYMRALLARGYRGPAILEIGGLPKSGGYNRDTDAALADSLARLNDALLIGTP